MRSKEAIRNRILSYTNLIWGTKKIERFDAMIQMIIEELVNELYLVQNKLHDIDIKLDEKIAHDLTDEKYIAVRPAHTIIHITPGLPLIELSKYTPFTLGEVPTGFIDQNADAINFHPIINTRLLNLKINHLFHHNQFYAVDTNNRKQLICTTQSQSSYNSIWLAVEIDPAIDNLEGVSFYIDFPELSEITELYDVLPYTQCIIGGKSVRLEQGFPLRPNEGLLQSDSDILDLYRDHYLTINEPFSLHGINRENLPVELETIIDQEKAAELKPAYWIKLVFNPAFEPGDLKDMVLAVNTFPASNKKLKITTIIKDNLSKITPLASDRGEKLLAVDSVKDDRDKELTICTSIENSQPGNYLLKTVNKLFTDEFSFSDVMGLLLDKLEDDRTAFPDLDKQKISHLLSSTLSTGSDESKKADINMKENEDIIARIFINPHKTTAIVNVSCWVTYGEFLNGISAGRMFLPDKNSSLDGYMALCLCEINGAREISDLKDLKAINHFILNSRDDIITDDDIISFCESELGKMVESIGFNLTECESIKPLEGIIRVLEVSLKVSSQQSCLIYQKGILKSLKTRLKKRSPIDYNYTIRILEN